MSHMVHFVNLKFGKESALFLNETKHCNTLKSINILIVSPIMNKLPQCWTLREFVHYWEHYTPAVLNAVGVCSLLRTLFPRIVVSFGLFHLISILIKLWYELNQIGSVYNCPLPKGSPFHSFASFRNNDII